MEGSSGHFIAQEWGSLSGQLTVEEADFMSQLLAVTNSNSNSKYNYSSENQHYCLTPTNSSYFNVANSICFSQESTTAGDHIFSTTKNIDDSMAFCLGLGPDFDHKISSSPWDENFCQIMNNTFDDDEGSGLVAAADSLKLQVLAHNNNFMVTDQSSQEEEDRSQNLAKRFRTSEPEVSRNMRNARKKPKSGSMSNNELERLQWHGFPSSFDANASVELNGITCSSLSPKDTQPPNNFCRKSKATSGPATDAQSIYARRRRERINERLKMLQNLVPNGTKVDISTMLEEAVQYVKFLQHQIQLLSSDDLWMYAPIAAYNGINIGSDLTISSAKGGTYMQQNI